MDETFEYNGKTITKNQFIGALYQYSEYEGTSIDNFVATMTWRSVLNNEVREDDSRFVGKTEKEIWMPLLEEYL